VPGTRATCGGQGTSRRGRARAWSLVLAWATERGTRTPGLGLLLPARAIASPRTRGACTRGGSRHVVAAAGFTEEGASRRAESVCIAVCAVSATSPTPARKRRCKHRARPQPALPAHGPPRGRRPTRPCPPPGLCRGPSRRRCPGCGRGGGGGRRRSQAWTATLREGGARRQGKQRAGGARGAKEGRRSPRWPKSDLNLVLQVLASNAFLPHRCKDYGIWAFKGFGSAGRRLRSISTVWHFRAAKTRRQIRNGKRPSDMA
jgi:hypothetical protein